MREKGTGRSEPDMEIFVGTQKPRDNWAGCRTSISGSRSDGDPIEDVMATGSVHQQTGQTL